MSREHDRRSSPWRSSASPRLAQSPACASTGTTFRPVSMGSPELAGTHVSREPRSHSLQLGRA
eukprot:11274614-Heterocapsa_arctica.AAC.1